MSRYIDGFVIPVPKDRIDEYRRMAETAGPIWKEHGALDYWECVGDDMDHEGMTEFPEIIKADSDEVVIFAWAVFESREARDKANEKIVADERLKDLMNPDNPVFDCKRMAFGGFKQLVHV